VTHQEVVKITNTINKNDNNVGTFIIPSRLSVVAKRCNYLLFLIDKVEFAWVSKWNKENSHLFLSNFSDEIKFF